jgi:hypothetical protein
MYRWHYRWAVEALRVSKPGAMLCAFGGTRTHHRLMCAIEDAGWEIRDVLMWVYGSGFPKSHDVSKAIDKAAGAEREPVTSEYTGNALYRSNGQNTRPWMEKALETGYHEHAGPTPATDDAALWDGWGTALKPAYEPIILAMKPLPSTFAQNALEYGVAGIWVDGCRVGTNGETIIAGHSSRTPEEGWDRPWRTNPELLDAWRKRKDESAAKATRLGRWPANLLLSHAPGCECVGVRKVKGDKRGSNGGKVQHQAPGANGIYGAYDGEINTPMYGDPNGTETIGAWRCVEGCPVRLLDEGSGETSVTGHYTKSLDKPDTSREFLGQQLGTRDRRLKGKYAGDTGGASRFFTRFHYSAKASRAERELGLLGHIPCLKCGELDSVTHINPKTGKEEKCRRNGHPTVKPLDVCRWLCRLTKTPTGGVVLDPFMGSGRIPMAAILEGRDAIGIELERPSFEIAEAGVRWAEKQIPEMVQVRMTL